MTEEIKKYLEAQVKRDAALKAKYKSALLDKCVGYITSEARKMLGGKSGYVDDAVVYKWARDYFIEGIAEKQAKDEAKQTSESKKAQDKPKAKEKTEQKKSATEKPVKTATGRELEGKTKPETKKPSEPASDGGFSSRLKAFAMKRDKPQPSQTALFA